MPGTKKILHEPFVNPQCVFLPPLHIKLGLMKIFVKALGKEGVAFLHLRNKFTHLSEAKVKEGDFIRPQIKAVFRDEEFEKNCQKQKKQPGWHSNQCAHISLEISKLKTMKILLVTW
ncbi:hypothetical protein AVEN_181960-1 [Araneus ventricosus]|uniref:Uncharacterized protein n=1 Tax=Araneus ventricosus TaxID=182803 RepID=A0A4Y2STC9_ARAVE|nr:hypothetical protein AVEN_181960-1 [Araneus ventricosus]